MTTYGYIGLGDMGSAMAEYLVATGVDLVVYDLDPEAVEKLVGLGASAAASAAEVAERADIVSICVPAAPHIEAVLTGDAGIADTGRDGQPILIHSTVHPDTITGSHATASAWGGVVFDACVAGGTVNAREGDLAVFAGAADEMPTEVRALLDVYGSKVIEAGPRGSGAALKIAVNVMTYAQSSAAATCHALVEGAGGDPASLLEAWRHIGMLGELTERYTMLLGMSPADIDEGTAAFLQNQVGIAQKDLELALELGDSGPGRSPFVEAIHRTMPGVYRTEPMPTA